MTAMLPGLIDRSTARRPGDIAQELIVDNFAGAGGASLGIEAALGRFVDVAINHSRAVKPRVIILENVEEFVTWGPLDAAGNVIKAKRGQTFLRWTAMLRNLGYEVEHRELVAAIGNSVCPELAEAIVRANMGGFLA